MLYNHRGRKGVLPVSADSSLFGPPLPLNFTHHDAKDAFVGGDPENSWASVIFVADAKIATTVLWVCNRKSC